MLVFLVFLSYAKIGEGIRHACIYRNFYINCNKAGLTALPKIETTVSEAVFSNNGVTTLTGVLYDNVEILDVSGNRIRTLNWTSTGLTHFNISRNPLWKVTRLDAPNLKEIDLSSCGLSMLNENFFNGTPSLVELHVSNNPLKKIVDNNLHILIANNCRLTGIPFMPQVHTVEVSGNPYLTSILTTSSMKVIKASNCKLSSIHLNSALSYLDISRNEISELKLNDNIEVLIASWNFLRSIDLDKDTLKTVDLSNNVLNRISVKLPSLESLDLAKNPIIELRVLCNSCHLDCSFCQVKTYSFYRVKFLNLSYNNLETVELGNVESVDLRHNLIKEFSSDADFFDLRHNVLRDVEKVSVTGVGYVGGNPWPCHCDTLKRLRPASKDVKLCELAWDDCYAKVKKKGNLQPFVIGFVVLVVLVLLIYIIRVRFKIIRNRARDEVTHEEITTINRADPADELPSYEQALRMAKPDWTSRESLRSSRDERQN
ncbi:uncharacterized protein LOC106663106 [Cimex lectularius]|uniref:Uncharacterized protein n=1 Tax=Cimex lectularius TaxID=79782 RepID=A0A8I6RDA4_CIMLE|nr:uncharacterized protein LOC106663106 [Cimex lectularius]